MATCLKIYLNIEFPIPIHQSPEKLVIEHGGLVLGPVVFELADLLVECSEGMRSKEESGALPGRQVKVSLEIVDGHLAIPVWVRMTLLPRCLPSLDDIHC